jgi:hypothetical protein
VTFSEIRHAFKKMKTEKSPAKNGIPPGAHKILVGLGEDVLKNIIRDFWTKPEFNPEIWRSGDLEACSLLKFFQSQVIFPTPTNGVVSPCSTYAQRQ